MRSVIPVLLSLLIGTLGADEYQSPNEYPSQYLNKWVVEVPGGALHARSVARRHGYVYVGHVPGFENLFVFERRNQARLSKRGSASLTHKLSRDRRITWVEQQTSRRREKKFFIGGSELGIVERVLRGNVRDARGSDRRFNDELWDRQWYMHDTRTDPRLPRLDLQVLPVYDEGITGKGVKVTVVDDGLEWRHDDLRDNYDPEISHDCVDGDDDPTPRYGGEVTNWHGTRCAGEIAMSANNFKCGVGVAYDASIGGIRLLDGVISDLTEGIALGFNVEKVDVFSNSWGPTDDGVTVEGPGTLALKALEKGISKGRGGRGSIYVWASGNGGTNGDNCNCDGYASSIYTLSVGSASENGSFPFYGEKCASTVAVTYSAGAYTDQTVATTDVGNACTLKHTGTSAAAPLAAGLVALTLQANPELTWRDMQHVVVWTADPLALERNAGWSVNAAGFPYSSRFGFGLLGAHRMVQAARRWAPVPPKSTCERAWSGGPFATNGSRGANASLETDGCHGTDREIRFLEHVELRLTVRYPRRGALRLGLTSPRGSESEVLSPRPKDKSKAGFRDWKFMSVHFWGEDPAGTWRFFLDDTERESMDPGEWRDVSLILHGTKDPPPYRAAGQSKLSALASTSHL